MIFRDKIRPLTLILSALNLVSFTLVLLVWFTGERDIEAPFHLAARHLAMPDVLVLTPAEIQSIDVASIKDNAVFHTRRTFYQAPVDAPTIAVPEYELAGSMGLPAGKRVAFVRRKSDKGNRTLHVGDDLDGWRVEAIDPARVLLARDLQRVELKSGVLEAGLTRNTSSVSPSSPSVRASTPGAQPVKAGNPINVARTYQPPPPIH